jgi:hypothetical protein
MRTSSLAGLALAAALVLPQLARAEGPRVEITDVRVGYPGSTNRQGRGVTKQGRFKTGAWAPVYVDLDVRDAPLQGYVLVVETTDNDDLQNVYVERRFLPPITPPAQPTLLAYVRVGSAGSEVTVHLRDARTGEDVCKKKQISQGDINPLEAKTFTYLTVGGKADSLPRALINTKQQPAGAKEQPGAEPEDAPPPDESGIRSFAHVDTVREMPTYWFGYQSMDAVVLLTGKNDFVKDLSQPGRDDPISARRDALAEWVRRGGTLIVSVGKNQQEANEILKQMRLLKNPDEANAGTEGGRGIDLVIEGSLQVDGLPGVTRWAGAAAAELRGLVPKNQPGAKPVMEIAKLKAGRGVQVLAYARAGAVDLNAAPEGDHPVIVQAPYGLGHVILTAFDLDEQPFTSWVGNTLFWGSRERSGIKSLIEPTNIVDDQGKGGGVGFNTWRDSTPELAGKLTRSLEAFPDVPVISFGWVALFILIYILIVGPLDYFFLKKVVKRLELTWITFPAVVIVISAVAYFAAYHLKGKDLRINKVDVVDVDLRGGNVSGNTWFTLFSPRIKNYTVGVEPGTGWGPQEQDPKKYGPFVSWMGRPEEMYNYGGRGGGGLFRRAYEYAPAQKDYPDEPPSGGLIGVPIQVWSTKTFSASWARPIKDDELFETRLSVAENDPAKEKLSGTIKSRVQVDLRNVALFYRDKYYALDNLPAGGELRVDDKMAQGKELGPWFNESLGAGKVQAGNKAGSFNQELPQPVGSYVKSILFHTHPADTTLQSARNSSLRFLDQRWRLNRNNRDEAILFARVDVPANLNGDGNAEEVSQSAVSACKLWLDGLPGHDSRKKIDGSLSQETYVRVYIPVNTAK